MTAAVSKAVRPLTDKERDVVSLLASGLTNAEVAQTLGMNRRGVEARLFRASRALGARSTAHAVYLALQTHQIPPQPCGTPAAYHWHRKRGDHPCTACRAAWSAYVSRRRRELREERRRNGLPTP